MTLQNYIDDGTVVNEITGPLVYKPKAKDQVDHPDHYTSGPIECIDAMQSAFGDEELKVYCKIAAFKYLWRSEKKGNEYQDIQKAKWYIDKWLDISSPATR